MVFLVEQHMDVERAGARQHPHDKEVGRQQQVSAGPHEENWNQEEWRVVAFVGEVIREARAIGTLSVSGTVALTRYGAAPVACGRRTTGCWR